VKLLPIAVPAVAALLTACSGSPSAPAANRATASLSPAAVTSAPASTASRVYAWSQGPGGKAEKALGAQLGKFAKDAQAGDLTAGESACARIGTIVTTAQAAPSIPDARAQRFWALSLTKLETAGADCQTGISQQDPSMMNQANAAILIATNDLAQATARANALGGAG
jgi:hypothetical protein